MGKKKPYERERPATVAFRMSEETARKLDADLLWIVRAVSEEYGAMASAEPIKDANEAMRAIERYR